MDGIILHWTGLNYKTTTLYLATQDVLKALVIWLITNYSYIFEGGEKGVRIEEGRGRVKFEREERGDRGWIPVVFIVSGCNTNIGAINWYQNKYNCIKN